MLKATHYAGDGTVIKVYKDVDSYITGMGNEVTLLITNDKTREWQKKKWPKGCITPTMDWKLYTQVTIFGTVVFETEEGTKDS